MSSNPDIAALRARITRLERGTAGRQAPAVPLGLSQIDTWLPGGGLPAAALHEVFGSTPGDDAAAGFALLLLSRFAQDGRLVLWCRNRAATYRQGLPPLSPYAPGLTTFGLDPGRVLLVQATRDHDALWAMEETLKEPAFAAVLGELTEVSRVGGRRLQLAAETHGVTALLLRPGKADPAPTAAVTRWQATARPSVAGQPAWHLELLRARGGRPGAWMVVRNRDALHPGPDAKVTSPPSP